MIRPPESHRRSRRSGRRKKAATMVATHATTSTNTTTRFPNSTTGWRLRGGGRRRGEQVGQSGQPRPESDSRTAAPVATLSITVASVNRQRKRNGRGPIRREDTVSVWYWPCGDRCLATRDVHRDPGRGSHYCLTQWRSQPWPFPAESRPERGSVPMLSL